MPFDFSTATVGRVLKILREIYFQSRILHPAELSIKATGVYALPKQINKARSGERGRQGIQKTGSNPGKRQRKFPGQQKSKVPGQ